jgi:hypothetical protein
MHFLEAPAEHFTEKLRKHQVSAEPINDPNFFIVTVP